MTASEFEVLLKNRLVQISSVLQSKAGEYATQDRLHNFKRAAEILGITPSKACLGMLSKHLVSVLDLVNDHEQGNRERVDKLLDEKIGDTINYLILLEALLKE